MVACWPVNNPFCMKSKMGEVGFEVLMSKTDGKPFLLKKPSLSSFTLPVNASRSRGVSMPKWWHVGL